MLQGCVLTLALNLWTIAAVPLQDRGVRIRRDEEVTETNSTLEFNGCRLEDKAYPLGAEVASLSPCEVCTCQPPHVVCSMIRCPVSSGCRTIQEAGQCCPTYKCDCEYNGRSYNNGQRLEKPEDPCQVCYCKGGEVMCTSVSCYEREDCEPRYLPGLCCPRYDHCPLEPSKESSSNSIRSVNASVYSPKREMQPWPLTRSSSVTPDYAAGYEESASPSSVPPASSQPANYNNNKNNFPQTIKILEILPTTPGYDNKLSEISVGVPRVKTVDEAAVQPEQHPTKEADEPNTKDVSEITNYSEDNMITTTEHNKATSTNNPFSEPISATINTDDEETVTDKSNVTSSEIEDLIVSTVLPEDYINGTLNPLSEQIQTTVDEDDNGKSTKETVTVSEDVTSSEVEDLKVTSESKTLNPFSESISSTYSPHGLPDSIKMAKIIHNYTSTENFQSVVTEATTNEGVTVTEGTGYELLQGGIYDEASTENFENTTDSNEIASDEESKQNYETPSTTENYSPSLARMGSEIVETNESFQDNENLKDNSSSEESNENEQNIPNIVTTTHSGELTTETSTENYSYNDLLVENATVHEINSFSTFSDIESTTYPVFNDTSSFSQNLDSITESNESIRSKKVPRDVSRKLIETRQKLSFPTVLKVQSVGAETELSPQTESSPIEDSAAPLAQVGIYHPTKTNELAGYLKLIGEKNVSSTVNGSSPQLILTPQDLKKLAEILIKEKIKPANSENSKNDTNVEERSFGNNKFSSESNEFTPVYEDTGSLETDEDASYSKLNEKDLILTTVPISNSDSSRLIGKDSSSQRYVTLLDERDMRILENFLRKNIDLP